MLQIVFIDTDEYQFGSELKAQMRRIIEAADKEVRVLLPKLSTRMTVTVHPTDQVIPETGEVARAMDKNWISYAIDPNHKIPIEKIVDNSLRQTYFHEASHCERYITQEWGVSIVFDAIFEGLGCVFERDYADATPPWGEYDPNVIGEWTQELLALKSEGLDKDAWLFKLPDGRRWVAYRVGTYIVDQALKNNPNETAATLNEKSAETILKMSRVAGV